MTDPQPEPRPVDPFAPLAVWMANSIVLLSLAAFGPRLWASQRADAAAIAVELVAVGQVLLAAILWPVWTRTVASAVAVVATSPVWLLLAGQLAQGSNESVLGIAWKLASLLTGAAVIRAVLPERTVGMAWSTLAGITLGGPALWFLSRTY